MKEPREYKEVVGRDPCGYSIRVFNDGRTEVSLWATHIWPDKFIDAVDAFAHFQNEANKAKFCSPKEQEIISQLQKIVKNNYSDKLKLKRGDKSEAPPLKIENSFFPQALAS